MYQRARKLDTLASGPADFFSTAELQIEAYAISINALSLVDQKSAWFVIPASSDGDREVGACQLSVEQIRNYCSKIA